MEQNKPQTEQEISQQAAVRRQKLADLCEAGHNPFEITKYAQDAYSADLKQEFADLPAEAETGKIVSLAGRMMSKRVMGKASFAHLRDQKGDIQILSSATCWAMRPMPLSKSWTSVISSASRAKCSAPRWARFPSASVS